jgi:hypothetical protein
MNWSVFDGVFSRVIRISGLIGVAWEAAFEHIDRPYLLFMFACMMGISKWDSLTDLISSKVVGKGS